MKFSIKDFFNKCDQIRRKLLIWPHLLKNSLMENFFFCAVTNFDPWVFIEEDQQKSFLFISYIFKDIYVPVKLMQQTCSWFLSVQKKIIIFFITGLDLRINRFISVDMWLLHFLWTMDYLGGCITILWFFLKLLF